ncbi:MAG: peptide chain release factor N(5)-glutamine methyltransferase [Litoreibacter sp.]|nr:peptide chain release factor N(5)-glutamine methyltransferase [Litoreibacter sp.]
MSSIREVLTAGAHRLRAAGVADPGRDARLLLDHVLGGQSAFHDGISEQQEAAYEAALLRRENREPVSHITGERAFWRHSFRVTGDVLDPRPETETLIAAALEAPFERVLDLGTGSGCILISLLAERQGAAGVGVDICEAALKIARQNADRIGVADRATFLQSDWWEKVSGKFDLIVSNPPYIKEAVLAELAPEVRDWEPTLALTPGGDGLAAYRVLAGRVQEFLSEAGRVLVEIGHDQGADVSELFRKAGFARVETLRDLDGRDRVVRVS